MWRQRQQRLRRRVDEVRRRQDVHAGGWPRTRARSTRRARRASALFQLSTFAYDSLVGVDPKTGDIVPQLATSWKVDGTTVTFELGSGITCSDGSAFDAKTVVDNISYVEDPKNKSPFLGVFIPAGATAKASGSTVTLKLAAPAPFVLNSMSNLPMVCESGMKDRASLKDQTAGTGPYVLTKANPGVDYVYKVRDGYTWGPDGATTAENGTPAQIDVKIVANETTGANEILSGAVNAVQIVGPDAARLKGAGLTSVDTTIVIGEQWYNHESGRPTNDPAVRMALTQGADYGELGKVLTSGKGTAATQLAALPQTGCTGNSVSGNVPAFDVNAANSALDAAGWTEGLRRHPRQGRQEAVADVHPRQRAGHRRQRRRRARRLPVEGDRHRRHLQGAVHDPDVDAALRHQ